MGGQHLAGGCRPLQAAVGDPAQLPSGGLVAQPVVVSAQAAEVVVRGRSGRPGHGVVLVAADRSLAASRETAATVAQPDEPLQSSGGGVGVGGRWWPKRLAGAESG